MTHAKAGTAPAVRNALLPWAAPVLEELPKLEKLTLESNGDIRFGGEIDGTGSTAGGGSLIFQ